MSFFDELKRRNVFRVAIAFAITAWLIAQIAGLAADSFGAPEWVMKMIITMLLLGFPIAMVMAWAYEMTPEGLRRDAGDDSSHTENTAKLDRSIIIALVAALAYFAYDKFVLDPQRDTALLESVTVQTPEAIPTDEQAIEPSTESTQSIAVLPFVNMSEDAGNEYFADGLSEELLNLLVRIPELKVAARTSSFSYKGKDTKIAQIGEELNVAHVLEGSVRKSGNQLRITAQLIKADDGYHVWSQTYDRTLDNIFQIQDDISAAVVDGLKVTLLGAVPVAAETDPEVYSLYLQGKFFMKPPASDEDLEKAVTAFKQALAIDPEYAPAWLGLSWAYEYQRAAGTNRTWEEQVALTREAAANGLTLDDNLALAWSTTSFHLKKYDWDWEGAEAAADKALQLEPNNYEVLLGTSSVATSLGQLDKAIELLERAVAVNPLELEGMMSLAFRYSLSGRIEDAMEMYRHSLVLFPDNYWAQRGMVAIHFRQGDLERALAEIEKLPYSHSVINFKAEILFALGREAEARALVSEFLNTPKEEHPFPKALIYIRLGEIDSAFESLDLAFEQRNVGLDDILVHHDLTRLKDDPRYLALVEKMGLLSYWEAMQ